MSDELNETPDSQQDEAIVQDQELESTDSEVNAADLVEKNKQLYERVKKAEAKAKELEKYKPKEILQTNQSSSDSDERFERLELKTEGYSTEEVNFLMRNGGRKALEDSIAMAGIEALRQKAKSQNATPSGTAKSAVYQKYTERDLKSMSAEELMKIVPQE